MEKEEIKMWEVMPAVALRGLTIFPHMIIHFDLSRQKSIIAVEQAMMQVQKIFVITQKDTSVEEPVKEELYQIGTVAVIKQVSKLPGGLVRVLVEGITRGRLKELESISVNLPEDEFLQAQVEVLEEAIFRDSGQEMSIEEEAMLRQIKDMVAQYSLLYPKIGKGLSAL